MSDISFAEYIWLDGANSSKSSSTQTLRSKSKVVKLNDNPSIEDFPQWNFDGSSTNQATGEDSDCLLQPVFFTHDPFRNGNNYLVLCEVLNPDGTIHATNSRAQLRNVLDAGAKDLEPWIGFEQEYTLFEHRDPLGWPEDGFPAPQGPYYCGVGADVIFGREIAEEHAEKCVEAGLLYYGMNAEVMAGQWEYQIGYRGIEDEKVDVLTASDHAWVARWILHRVGETYGVHASLDNKPVKGDWNGAGMHTNFSTNTTRDKKAGREAIKAAISALSENHSNHIYYYGDKLSERLTGLHETSDIDSFSAEAANRGCSIRIPRPVEIKGYGYFEDRRPGANADPYLVAARLCTTVCGISDTIMNYTLPNKKPLQPKAKKAVA